MINTTMSSRSFQCVICKRSLASRQSLQRHVETQHRPGNDNKLPRSRVFHRLGLPHTATSSESGLLDGVSLPLGASSTSEGGELDSTEERNKGAQAEPLDVEEDLFAAAMSPSDDLSPPEELLTDAELEELRAMCEEPIPAETEPGMTRDILGDLITQSRAWAFRLPWEKFLQFMSTRHPYTPTWVFETFYEKSRPTKNRRVAEVLPTPIVYVIEDETDVEFEGDSELDSENAADGEIDGDSDYEPEENTEDDE